MVEVDGGGDSWDKVSRSEGVMGWDLRRRSRKRAIACFNKLYSFGTENPETQTRNFPWC
jgi:hypothetical protein